MLSDSRMDNATSGVGWVRAGNGTLGSEKLLRIIKHGCQCGQVLSISRHRKIHISDIFFFLLLLGRIFCCSIPSSFLCSASSPVLSHSLGQTS
jgi:hypothetical protein